MVAIRQIQEIRSGKITVTLPTGFPAGRAEIIILPIEEFESSLQHLQHTLLNAPTLSEEELQAFTDVRDWMNQWNVSNS